MVESPTPPELNVDAASFITWYNTLEDDPTIVRLFDRKGYYSAHGDAANLVAEHLYKSTALVKTLGRGDATLLGITFGSHMLPNLLHWLLVQQGQYRIEMYEGSGSAWQCTKTASPGRLADFDEELLRASGDAAADAASLSVAVTIGSADGAITVGVAVADLARRTLSACQFMDDVQLCSLERMLVQVGAKECVVPKDIADTEARRLADVLERCGMLVTARPKATFTSRSLEQDLPKLLKPVGNGVDGTAAVERHRDVLDSPYAAQALGGLIHYTELWQQPDEHGKYTLELYNPNRFMRLDAAALRALHVFGEGAGGASASFSLYALLSKAKTAMGKRLVKVWLKQPLLDMQAITTRHDVVDAFVQDAELRTRLRGDVFRGMPDVERLTRKLDTRRATLADLCALFRASGKLEGLIIALRGYEGPHAALLHARFADPLAEAHDQEHLAKFEDLVEAAIDLDRLPDEYIINPGYSASLQSLAQDKAGVEARIEELAQEAAGDLKLVLDKTIKLEWHRANNVRTRCLRITQKEERAVRSKLQARYSVIETRKDGTKFTNTKLRKAAEELQAAARQYDELQADLVAQVMGVAATFVEVWERVAMLLAELDALLGFAELAVGASGGYVRPCMLSPEGGELSLVGARHPCLEAQEGSGQFIPNDCVMRKGESWFQIITGPNMGGKSTYIRQVGAIVLMAQVGSFVPCSEASIAVRDAIFARVGAGDNQLRGVSTFMAEMLETAAILKGATASSLVIIDELGRGTSTYDGFGLAWAISEHLMQQVGCPVLFATHFHELTAIRGACGVHNLHVETAIDHSTGKLCMLYQVKPGVSDQSFGIHVAEFAGFPEQVVQAAKRKAAELEGDTPLAVALGVAQGEKQDFERWNVYFPTYRHNTGDVVKRFKELPLAIATPAEAVAMVARLLEGAAA